MEDKAKTKIYTQLDLMMQHLNRNFISLQDVERKAYVEHFIKVLDKFILIMKQNDVLFDATFQRLCGAGSYFDGLKVGKATEFDMDVVVKLPIDYKQIEVFRLIAHLM
ncbi:unnamed protein product, partial [Timema podura]|nr:unnamed protein product [Timema podura]